eukprot:IDg4239t1
MAPAVASVSTCFLHTVSPKICCASHRSTSIFLCFNNFLHSSLRPCLASVPTSNMISLNLRAPRIRPCGTARWSTKPSRSTLCRLLNRLNYARSTSTQAMCESHESV